MELINLMPMLIKYCRTRLFLAIIQQRTLLGGTRTLPLQEQLTNFTLIAHHDSADLLC